MLPGWQRAVAPWVRDNHVVVIGVVQEQHPDRAALYRQWKKLDWPIAVDALNTLGLAVVPVVLTIDESGVIHHRGLRQQQLTEEFLGHTFAATPRPPGYRIAQRAVPRPPDPCADPQGWMAYGDAHFHDGRVSEALAAFDHALCADPDNGPAMFRLGVAYQRRSESPDRQPRDAQAAVDMWLEALETNPNQYIWRRRIQQYGPRLDKPYDFYSWVRDARRFIIASGQTPVPLSAEPRGSELLSPAAERDLQADPTVKADPEGRINRDAAGHVVAFTRVTPRRVQPGQHIRAQISLRLSNPKKAVWNNEAAPLTVFLDPPDGIRLSEGMLSVAPPGTTESTEERVIDFEMIVSAKHNGEVIVPGYALFNICQKASGKCFYLRKDFDVRFKIDAQALELK